MQARILIIVMSYIRTLKDNWHRFNLITVNNRSVWYETLIRADGGMIGLSGSLACGCVYWEKKLMEFKQILQALLLVSVAALTSACSTAPAAPTETYDGLVLVPDTRLGVVYKRPGADLTGYDSYGLMACEVAFKKNWQRDQNSSRIDLSSRVTQKDVDRIKDKLGEECGKYFREALEQAPPYQLVERFSDGEQVLILRPAIINLDISAPDTRSSGMQRTYTTSAGQMTLLLELLDGTTGEILVRVVDAQRSRDTSNYLQWSNSVTNDAEARRILSRWAGQLRKGLDEVTGHARTGEQ